MVGMDENLLEKGQLCARPINNGFAHGGQGRVNTG